jgi:hypothetical protein
MDFDFTAVENSLFKYKNQGLFNGAQLLRMDDWITGCLGYNQEKGEKHVLLDSGNSRKRKCCGLINIKSKYNMTARIN